MITYRQLLEAIQTAKEIQSAVDDARADPKRFKGTPEEQDNADSRFRSLDAELDEPIVK